MAQKRIVRRSRPAAPVPQGRDLRGLLERTVSKLEGDLLASDHPEAVVVGIDASLTKYGLSIFGLESGRHATMLFKPKLKGAQRLMEIWEFVTLVVNVAERNFEVREYFMEQYAFGARASQAHAIGEGGGATKLALIMRYGGGDPIAFPTLVAPNSLKKFVTGKGSGEKNQILLSVFKKWGVDNLDDNQADAYGLARLGAALLSGHTDYAYEAEVVAAVERNTEWPKP